MSNDRPTPDETTRDDSPRHTNQDKNERPGVSDRRRFLLSVGAATALLAGCISDDPDDEDGTDDAAGTPGDDDPDDGADDDPDDGTDDDPDDGADDDPDDGTDDPSDDPDDGTDDPSDDPDDGTDDPSDDTDDGTDDDRGDSPTDAEQFFTMIAWDEDYRMAGTAAEDGQTFTFEMRLHGGDSYMRVESDEFGSNETYRIGNLSYFVQADECMLFEQEPGLVPDPIDRDDPDDIEAEQPTVTELGPDTVDGDPVTAYELVFPDGETAVYFLLASGSVRRIEFEGSVIDFFDWGATEPVEPPDMECTSPAA